VSVIAHSYGTTTSASALHDINFTVDDAVFVASAGIDTTVVPNAAAMHIATVDGKEQLCSTQASSAPVATVGRAPAGVIAFLTKPIGSLFEGATDSRRGYPG